MKKQAILLTLCIAAVLVSVSAVSAADSYVNGSVTASGDGSSWEQAVQTISEGYNIVTDGYTMYIAAGEYTGTENRDITIDKSITIQGAGEDQTTINCEGSGNVFTVNSGKTVTINDLTIKNCNEQSGFGSVIFNGGTLNINSCAFKDNNASWSPISNFGTTLVVNNSNFEGNRGTFGGAIFNHNSVACTVSDCTFTSNTAVDGGAIHNEYGGNCAIFDSIFTGNSATFGGTLTNYGIMNIKGSNFYKNTAVFGGAIFNADAPPGEISDLNVEYSRFVGNTASNTPNDIYIGGGSIKAKLNWWGNNNGPEQGRITDSTGNVPGPETYTPWLVMNIKADPSTINTGQTSTITADVYTDSEGKDHSADAAQFFSGPEVTFTTDLGSFSGKTVTVNWDHGKAVVVLKADEEPGLATITGQDVQKVQTTVNILQAPVTPEPVTPQEPKTPSGNEVNAVTITEGTVGMQETGIPIAGLILAVLMLFGGLVASKR